MIESGRLKDQLYVAAVIALLLLTSVMSGAIAVTIAAALIAVGLVLYPEMRRTGIVAALIAAAVATVVVLVRSLM